ncbi:hypothetical protein MSPP1_002131 [Malassezia sp. CBS 17886]|nr:hypothetical protein MSPP1_002131 [Malassezia sp. CBS 17886]
MSGVQATDVNVKELQEAIGPQTSMSRTDASDSGVETGPHGSDGGATQAATAPRPSGHTTVRAAPRASRTLQRPLEDSPASRGGLNVEHLCQLQVMFPASSATSIATVLRSRHGDMDAAVTTLLEMNDPGYEPTRDEEHSVHSAMRAQEVDAEQRRAFEQSLGPTPSGAQTTWDPTNLRYHPRVLRPRPPLPQRVQPSFQPSPWSDLSSVLPTSEEARHWQDGINRIAGTGMAKVGSTFSTLRQRAESAMRNMPADRSFRRPGRPQDPLYVPPAGGGNAAPQHRHQRIHAELWDPVPTAVSGVYDNDPHHVLDTDLDEILEAAPADRYAQTTGAPPPRAVPPPVGAARYTPAVPAGPARARPLNAASSGSWGQGYATPAAPVPSAEGLFDWGDVGRVLDLGTDDDPLAQSKGKMAEQGPRADAHADADEQGAVRERKAGRGRRTRSGQRRRMKGERTEQEGGTREGEEEGGTRGGPGGKGDTRQDETRAEGTREGGTREEGTREEGTQEGGTREIGDKAPAGTAPQDAASSRKEPGAHPDAPARTGHLAADTGALPMPAAVRVSPPSDEPEYIFNPFDDED